MQKKLWEATISQKENSNLRSFEKYLNNKYNFKSNKIIKNFLNGVYKTQILSGVIFGTLQKLKGLNH